MDHDYPSAVFLNRGVIYMEFENLLTLIGNYAFPICCCVYLFWSSAKEREAHKEELAKVTEALQNNTLAINDLKGMLQRDR